MYQMDRMQLNIDKNNSKINLLNIRNCLMTNDVETTSLLNHKLSDETGHFPYLSIQLYFLRLDDFSQDIGIREHEIFLAIQLNFSS